MRSHRDHHVTICIILHPSCQEDQEGKTAALPTQNWSILSWQQSHLQTIEGLFYLVWGDPPAFEGKMLLMCRRNIQSAFAFLVRVAAKSDRLQLITFSICVKPPMYTSTVLAKYELVCAK